MKMHKMLQQCPTLWFVQSVAHWGTLNRTNPETNLLLTAHNDVYVADRRPKPFHACLKKENFYLFISV